MLRPIVVVSALVAFTAGFALGPVEAPAGPKDYKVVEVKDGGSIRGFVKLSAAADVPPVEVFKDNEKGCGDKQHASERLKYDKATLGLGNALVYLKSIDAGKDWPEAMKSEDRMVLLDQKGCQYVPHVGWLRAKTQLAVGNGDRADHNIHGYKGSMKDTQFNFASEPGSKKEDIEQAYLEAPDKYIVKCDIHPWMNAYVHVVDHPYHVLTSAEERSGLKPGEFLLDAVPPGDYVLVIWKEGMVETPTMTDNKISAYTYSPDVVKEFPVKVEAGKAFTLADYVIEAPKK
jgi:hypothetical protein